MEGMILGKKVLRIAFNRGLKGTGLVLSILFGIILGSEDDNPERTLEFEGGGTLWTLSDSEVNLGLALATLQAKNWTDWRFDKNRADPQLQISLSSFGDKDFNLIASHLLEAAASMRIVEI